MAERDRPNLEAAQLSTQSPSSVADRNLKITIFFQETCSLVEGLFNFRFNLKKALL